MADLQLNEDYRCGYCYQQFNSMTDPRELPCHHVFCLPCLKEDYAEHNNVRCRSCLTEHEIEVFDELPKAELDTEVTLVQTSLTCDCHNCDEQLATCYCVDCAVKMCEAHQQVHSSLLGNKHKTIPISSYELNPGIYKKILCEQHGGEVLEVCENCRQSVCIRCDSKEKTCQEGRGSHRFQSLNTLKEEITAHFNSLLQSASEKLTEICKVDKQIWKVLDDEEAECAERIQMIERICEEQIKLIRKESDELKEQIYEYQKELTDQVETYNEDLMTKKERLEESCTEVRKWMRESHVIDKMENKQQMTDELVKNIEVNVDCQLRNTPALIHTDKLVVQLPKLAAPPTSLALTSEHPTKGGCYSAAFGWKEDLLLGCSDGVRILKKSTLETTELTFLSVTSVLVRDNHAYFLERNENDITIYRCLFGVSLREKLFSFNHENDGEFFASASSDYFAVRKPKGQLVVYKLSTNRTIALTPTMSPSDVHFLPDGNLLLLNSWSETLIRYRIENDQLIAIWSCEGLEGASNITSDSDGFIYVTADDIKLVHIVSPEGKKLKVIHNDNLPKSCGQISIRGRDELAIPSWNESSVRFFKINH